MCFRCYRGVTLIEFLTTISICAILASATFPYFEQLIEKHRQHSQLFELHQLIQLARQNAVNSGHVTTLCGTHDGAVCDTDWSNPSILVFQDSDRDNQLGDNDVLIRKAEMRHSRWHWRGSATRPFLRFRNDGSAIEWGRFTRCPANEDATQLPQLVLNRVGRAYSTLTAKNDSGLCP